LHRNLELSCGRRQPVGALFQYVTSAVLERS
jgi:hypothetical protein